MKYKVKDKNIKKLELYLAKIENDARSLQRTDNDKKPVTKR